MPEGPPQDFVTQLLQAHRSEQERMARLYGLIPNLPREVSQKELMFAVPSFAAAGQPIEFAGQGQIRTMGDLLNLGLPGHYGYGNQWDQKGWLELLARARRRRTLSPQQSPFERGPASVTPEFTGVPTPPSLEAMPWKPGLGVGEALQRQRERILRQIQGSTTFYSNIPE